jgi:ketosteroid isomerase-like protein
VKRTITRAALSIFVWLSLAVPTQAAAAGDDVAHSMQHDADVGRIAHLEATFHQATTVKDLDLVMSIFTEDATLVAGGTTFSGKDAIQAMFANSALLNPDNHWVALTPAQKFQIDIQGDKGTFYFECHYFDVDSQSFAFERAVTTSVVRAGDGWLIREWRAAPTTLAI